MYECRGRHRACPLKRAHCGFFSEQTLDQLQALLGAKLQTLSLGAEHQSAAATSIAASIGKHDIATARAGEVRPRAKQMIEIYRQGQIDIAQNALVTAEEMFEHAYDQMEQAE